MRDFVTADGQQVPLRVAGQGPPRTVVLAGGPLRSPSYLGDLSQLARWCPLAVPDLPLRRVDQLVMVVDTLREHLELDQLDLLAHSAGASVALRYAAAHPQRLRRLVLVTPSTRAVGLAPHEQDLTAAIQQRRHEPWYPAARAALQAQEGGDQSPQVLLDAAPFSYGRWDQAAREHVAGGAGHRPADAASVFYADGALDPDRTRTALAEVSADVLVVGGQLDLVPTQAQLRALVALFPRAKLTSLPGAGHYPWLDDEDAFTTVIATFLRR